jgi:voltage-gated potassium channel
MQNWLQRIFKDERSKAYAFTSDFLAIVTILSIVSLTLETVPSLDYYTWLFVIVEWFAVVVFSFEYIGRLIISRPRQRYPLSFFGIIDLVSILPTILGLGNWTFLKSARAIRIIRLLRMLRLAKISRSGGDIEESFGVFGLNILIYVSTLLFALLIVGTTIYLVEPTNSAFVSIPAGMWWSFQVFLGGMPVTVPDTTLGGAVYAFGRFVGLLLLGLLVGVVGNIFRTYLLPKKSN